MGVVQRLRQFARAAALLAAVAAIGFLSLGGDTWIVQRVARHVAQGDARRVERRLRVAQTLGPHGVPLLVAGLSSDHDQIVHSSHRGLQELLLAWRHLPPTEAAEGMRVMSRELARQAPGFSPEGRRVAEQVVRELLDWPMAPALGVRDEVLASCERALRSLPVARAADPSAVRRVAFEPTTGEPEASTSTPTESAGLARPESDVDWFPEWLRLPGGGLPWKAENASPLPPWQPRFPDPDRTDPQEPRRIAPPPQRPPQLFRPKEARPLR